MRLLDYWGIHNISTEPTIFLDNNILIGYCFLQDPQHDKSKIIFQKYQYIYWSKNVRYEFNKKRGIFEELIDNIKITLNSLSNSIDKDDLINIALEHGKNSNPYSIIKIVNDIWDENIFKSTESSKNVVIHLEHYKKHFTKKLLKFKAKCYKLNCHERKDKYLSVEKKLENCIHGRDSLSILGNDMNICLDGHDLAKQNGISKLIFITDDNYLFQCKSLLETHTKIHGVMSLSEI
ncbi:MAG: hypothetical protein LBT10_08380 [Methanobrevibacter sp.]|jgi:hypothetical protein|nr:hypothetical protein [Methanobrevibacter sp.]